MTLECCGFGAEPIQKRKNVKKNQQKHQNDGFYKPFSPIDADRVSFTKFCSGGEVADLHDTFRSLAAAKANARLLVGGDLSGKRLI